MTWQTLGGTKYEGVIVEIDSNVLVVEVKREESNNVVTLNSNKRVCVED